jgi:hypothetical protein
MAVSLGLRYKVFGQRKARERRPSGRLFFCLMACYANGNCCNQSCFRQLLPICGVAEPCTQESAGCSINQMAKARPIVVLVLLALWTSVPVLACLPTHQMTQAEMACCKKMAGDCQMGSAQHPCCKMAPTVNAPVATVVPIAQFHPIVAVVSFTLSVQFEPNADGEVTEAHLGLPPPAPPGPNSILRI